MVSYQHSWALTPSLEHHNTSNNRRAERNQSSSANNSTGTLPLATIRARSTRRSRRLNVLADQLAQLVIGGIIGRDARAVGASAGSVGVGSLDEVDERAL